MGFRKTQWNKRGTYTYESVTGEKFVMRPGEKEVTQADIKRLHASDDAILYNDITNSRPPMSDEEKERKRQWEAEHPGEKYPANWNLSLDHMGYEDNGDDDLDKSRALVAACTETRFSCEEDTAEELMEKHLHFLTPIQRKVFYLREVEEYTGKEIARMLNVSEANVSKHYKKAKAKVMEIRNNI